MTALKRISVVAVALGVVLAGLPVAAQPAAPPASQAGAGPEVFRPEGINRTVRPGEPVGALPPGFGRSSGVGVEVAERRSARSRTFALPDGSFRTEVFTRRMHYRDADGGWAPIDSSLTPAGGPDGGWRNRANDVAVTLPQRLGGEPVSVEHAGRWVRFGLRDVATEASAAAVEGASARYDGLAPGVSVELTARPDGVKEDIVLRDAQAVSSFAFEVTASPGLAPLLEEGAVRLVDAEGVARFVLPPPFLAVSSGSPRGVSGDVEVTLEPAGDGWLLAYTPDPDRDWLGDAGRVWPVRLDPTVLIDAPVLDCHIIMAASDPSVADQSTCNYPYDGAGHDGWGVYRGLLKFDVAAAVPAPAAVVGAELNLTHATNSPVGELELLELTQAWDESASWNDRTATAAWSTPGGTVASPAAYTYVRPAMGR